MKKLSYVVLILLLACDLIVDIDVPFDKGITLNCFFTPDSLWKVQLIGNRHILDSSEFQTITDAMIVIYENDVPVDTLTHFEQGIYRSLDHKPLAGKKYSITAQSPGYRNVSAESIIPLPNSIIVNETRTSIIDNQPHTFLYVTIHDDKTKEDYYEVILTAWMQFYDYRSDKVIGSAYAQELKCDDPTIQALNEERGWYEGILLNDNIFNGTEFKTTFKSNSFVAGAGTSLAVTLRTLSKELYDYRSTLLLKRRVSDNPLAQPVNVFSNVNNGYGIFGGYSELTVNQTIPGPTITSLSSASGRPGDPLTIFLNSGFVIEDDAYVYVTFRGADGAAKYSFAAPDDRGRDYLTVVIPESVATGKIVLYYNNSVSVSDSDFIIE